MPEKPKLSLPKFSGFKFSLFTKKEEVPPKEEDVWPFKRTVCETLEEAIVEHPYLKTYLDSLPEKPKYVLNLELELEGPGQATNILYPLGLGIYAHIDVGGEIGRYNIIEPEKPDRQLLDEIEEAIATLVKDKEYSGPKEYVLASLFKQAIKKKLILGWKTSASPEKAKFSSTTKCLGILKQTLMFQRTRLTAS